MILHRFSVVATKSADGRWMASIAEYPGTHAYGRTEAQAVANALALLASDIRDASIAGEKWDRCRVAP